jgi:DNA repair exonuclease SbcCD ATPase subunit
MKEADEELQAERLKRDEAELKHVTEQLQCFQVQALPRLQKEQVDLHAELKRVKEQLEGVTQLKGVKEQLETLSDDLCAAGRASNESELAHIAEQLQSLPDLTQKAAVLQEELKRAREQLQIKQEKKDHEAELTRVRKEQVEVLTFLQQANSELQRKLNLAQEQLTTARSRVSELQMELKLKHVKEQLETLSNDPRVAGSASNESELAFIKEQLQSLPDLAQEAAELQEGLKRTREQLQIIPDLQQEKKDLEAELTRVHKEQLEALTFLEQAKSELQRKLNLAEEQLTAAQNRVSELQMELNTAKEQIQIIPDLQQEKEEIRCEFSRLKDQFQSLSFLQQANAEFQRHLILAQDLLATAHKRVSELQMELNVAKEQLQIIPDLQQEKEEIEGELNRMRKEQVEALTFLEQANSELQRKLNLAEEQLTTAQNRVEANPHLLRLQQANSELQRKLNLAHEQLTTALKRDYELQMELKVQSELQMELQSLAKKEHFECQDDNVFALKQKQCCAVRSAAPLRLSAASLQDQENQSEETFSTPPSSPPLGVSETFTTDSSSVGELKGTTPRISYNLQEQRTTAQKRESGLQMELNISKEKLQIIPDLKQAVFPGPVVYI